MWDLGTPAMSYGTCKGRKDQPQGPPSGGSIWHPFFYLFAYNWDFIELKMVLLCNLFWMWLKTDFSSCLLVVGKGVKGKGVGRRGLSASWQTLAQAVSPTCMQAQRGALEGRSLELPELTDKSCQVTKTLELDWYHGIPTVMNGHDIISIFFVGITVCSPLSFCFHYIQNADRD